MLLNLDFKSSRVLMRLSLSYLPTSFITRSKDALATTSSGINTQSSYSQELLQQIRTEKSPFQRTGEAKPELIPEAFLARLGDHVRSSTSFNQKGEILPCVTVNLIICLQLLDQVEMGHSHTG